MAVQRGHERLAEAHHLALAAALGVEVRAALATAQGQAGERVLEDLLEAEELDDAAVHAGVKTQPAFVGPQSGIELNAVALVDPHGAGVIHPGDAEQDLALRFKQALHHALTVVAGLGLQHGSKHLQHFLHGLIELGLSRAALSQTGHYAGNMTHKNSL